MLTRDEIQRLEIVQGASDASWDQTSYNLRLGEEYVHVGAGTPEVRKCSSFGIQIPPFGCVLVSTLEWLRLPKTVYGRWGLRIRPALSGLIFQAGPQIEPGYQGRLFGLLFNLSSSEYSLEQSSKLWSVDFTSLPGQEPSRLEEIPNAQVDLSINAYITSHFPKGGPGEALEALAHEFRSLQDFRTEIRSEVASLRAGLREEERLLEVERATTRNDQLAQSHARLESAQHKLVEHQSTRGVYISTFLFGGFIVLLCAFVPMIISKTMYEKSDFVTLLEGKHEILEMEKKIKEAQGLLEKQLAEAQSESKRLGVQQQDIQQQIIALRQSRPTPSASPSASPTVPSPSKPLPEPTNGMRR